MKVDCFPKRQDPKDDLGEIPQIEGVMDLSLASCFLNGSGFLGGLGSFSGTIIQERKGKRFCAPHTGWSPLRVLGTQQPAGALVFICFCQKKSRRAK